MQQIPLTLFVFNALDVQQYQKQAALRGGFQALLAKIRGAGSTVAGAGRKAVDFAKAEPLFAGIMGSSAGAVGAGGVMAAMPGKPKAPVAAAPAPAVAGGPIVNNTITKTEGQGNGELSNFAKLVGALGPTGIGAGVGAIDGAISGGGAGRGALVGAGTGAGLTLGAKGGNLLSKALNIQNPMGQAAMSAGGGLLGMIAGNKATKAVVGKPKRRADEEE